MSVGEIIFMVAVIAVAILMAILKSKVPAWLGFVLMLAASVVAIVGGAATGGLKAIPLGVAGVIGTIIAWVAGANSAPATNPDPPDDGTSARRDDPDTLGGIASRVRWWAWLAIAAVVAGAAAVTFAIPDSTTKSSKPAQRHAEVQQASPAVVSQHAAANSLAREANG